MVRPFVYHMSKFLYNLLAGNFGVVFSILVLGDALVLLLGYTKTKSDGDSNSLRVLAMKLVGLGNGCVEFSAGCLFCGRVS